MTPTITLLNLNAKKRVRDDSDCLYEDTKKLKGDVVTMDIEMDVLKEIPTDAPGDKSQLVKYSGTRAGWSSCLRSFDQM